MTHVTYRQISAAMVKLLEKPQLTDEQRLSLTICAAEVMLYNIARHAEWEAIEADRGLKSLDLVGALVKICKRGLAGEFKDA